jgi:hypothetical protein
MAEARVTWTDERLDDLARTVEAGFKRIDEDMRALRGQVERLEEGLDRRIDALQRTMIQLSSAITLGILATLVTVVLTRP